MRIPDLGLCIRLMEQYRMLDNIRHHSLVVARVADQLVRDLQMLRPGRALPDRRLVIAGALLHDIAKTPCLDGSCEHARVGAEICRDHGFPEVARIVAEHVILRDHDPGRYAAGIFTAAEIVYYADKRVRHAEIVSLDQRLAYILDHYGHNDPRLHELIRENFQKCVELEKHLFHTLNLPPERLPERLAGLTPAQDPPAQP